MIDIHTHLLPGVDDGSPSIEASLPVLQRFVEGGVTVVVCTPHLDASKAAQAPYERHVEILEELRAASPPGIELRLGWEIMLDRPSVDLRDPRLSLGGSRAVLVEFPRYMIPPNAGDELFRLRMSGLIPVLAHPERYNACNVEYVDSWRRMGAVIQMDAAGLLGGDRTGPLAIAMLENGLVDLIASDTHGDSRSLVATRQWLEEAGASEHADLLTRVNAGRVLDNELPLPVPPLERPVRGMLSRLKALVLGRR